MVRSRFVPFWLGGGGREGRRGRGLRWGWFALPRRRPGAVDCVPGLRSSSRMYGARTTMCAVAEPRRREAKCGVPRKRCPLFEEAELFFSTCAVWIHNRQLLTSKTMCHELATKVDISRTGHDCPHCTWPWPALKGPHAASHGVGRREQLLSPPGVRDPSQSWPTSPPARPTAYQARRQAPPHPLTHPALPTPSPSAARTPQSCPGWRLHPAVPAQGRAPSVAMVRRPHHGRPHTAATAQAPHQTQAE